MSRKIPEDPPPDPLPLETLHQQRTSVFYQSSCLLPPPDEDGTTSGISDGTSAGYQPERPPPLFRLDEEDISSQEHLSSFLQPSSMLEQPMTPRHQPGARHYQHPHRQQPTLQPQQQLQDKSQGSFMGEGSFSQSYDTASYPGLKILVPRLGFHHDDDDDMDEPTATNTPTGLGSRSPVNEDRGSILSTLSNEESTSGRICGVTINNKVLWIGVLIFSIFAGLTMAGTCIMDLCTHRSTTAPTKAPVVAREHHP